MKSELLSTGEAARLYSVTSDTVLKWIRAGRLPATRTPGGHHRVSRRDLEQVIGEVPDSEGAAEPIPEFTQPRPTQFRYCWEFNGKGELLDGCRECVVYQMRAKRCYEVVERAKEVGHSKVFCQKSCEECDYYRHVREQAPNILILTDNDLLASEIKKDGEKEGFNVEVADCEYRCSALVDMFRPDYAVVDCSLGAQFSRDITDHLVQDPRVPFIKVILAAENGGFPKKCNKEVFARIAKPFNVNDIKACIDGTGSGN